MIIKIIFIDRGFSEEVIKDILIFIGIGVEDSSYKKINKLIDIHDYEITHLKCAYM